MFAVSSPILRADDLAKAGKISVLVFPEKLLRIHKQFASNIAPALLPNFT